MVFIALFVTAFGMSANAQMRPGKPDIVKDPICFQLRNSADFTMYGNFATDYYINTAGTPARHRSNFRLEAAGSVHEEGYPTDRAEFCSYGPFFPDRKLELQIRTLFPVFSCMTRIDQGEIVLRADRKANNRGYDYYADCYE